MSETLKNTKTEKQEFNSKLLHELHKETADLPDVTEKEIEEAKMEVKKLEKTKRASLRKKIEVYRTKEGKNLDETERKVLEDIEKDIQEIDKYEQAKDSEVVKTKEEVKKELPPFQKFMENFTGPIKGMIKGLVAVLPITWIKKLRDSNPGGLFGRFANDILREKGVYTKMEEIFGPEKMVRTADDEKHIETLQSKYNALPTPEGGSKISFEQFYTAKMKAARKTGKAEYSLLDVVYAEADVEAAQESAQKEKEKNNEREKNRQKIEDRMEKITDVRHAVHLFAIAKAIEPNAQKISLNASEIQEDLFNRNAGDSFYYKKVTQQLLDYLKSYKAREDLGIEIDGGDLESANNTEWFYNKDMIANFEANLRDNPVAAYNKLANLAMDAGEWNLDTQRMIPKLQTGMREAFAELTSTSVPDAPVESSDNAS